MNLGSITIFQKCTFLFFVFFLVSVKHLFFVKVNHVLVLLNCKVSFNRLFSFISSFFRISLFLHSIHFQSNLSFFNSLSTTSMKICRSHFPRDLSIWIFSYFNLCVTNCLGGKKERKFFVSSWRSDRSYDAKYWRYQTTQRIFYDHHLTKTINQKTLSNKYSFNCKII
jgi:hypothetical protein